MALFGGQLLNGLGVVQNPCHFVGDRKQILHIRSNNVTGELILLLSDIQPEQIESNELRDICFCRCDSDFRSRVGVKHIVGLPGDARPNHIDDG